MVKKSKSISVGEKVGQMLEEKDVRAILAVLLVIGSLVLYFLKGDVPDWLSAIVGASVAFFFQKN